MRPDTGQSEHIGSTGAKRQTWKKANPRELLKQIVEETVSEHKAYEAFVAAIEGDQAMMEAIIEYWFANNYRSLTYQPVYEPRETARQREQMADKAATIIKTRAEQMVLLEMTMPNGKPLAECTGKEVANFGTKFLALSKAVRPNEKIGILSETEVRKFLR